MAAAFAVLSPTLAISWIKSVMPVAALIATLPRVKAAPAAITAPPPNLPIPPAAIPAPRPRIFIPTPAALPAFVNRLSPLLAPAAC